MNLLEKTKKICELHNIRPARSRGQNFLIKESVYDEILDAALIGSKDTILEVGPGLGFLTQKLAQRAKKVVAIELDDILAEVLETNFRLWGLNNVEIRNMNVLDFNPGELAGYKIVANLPYNITSLFLRKFLSKEDNRPQSLILMLQKEVVDRIVAAPPRMSLLALSVQYYADAEIIQYVPRDYFWPVPKVDSGIVKIVRRNKEKDSDFDKKFFRLLKFGFASKRKMLKNNLAAAFKMSSGEAGEIIKKAGFSEKTRAQELSITDWLLLLDFFML